MMSVPASTTAPAIVTPHAPQRQSNAEGRRASLHPPFPSRRHRLSPSRDKEKAVASESVVVASRMSTGLADEREIVSFWPSTIGNSASSKPPAILAIERRLQHNEKILEGFRSVGPEKSLGSGWHAAVHRMNAVLDAVRCLSTTFREYRFVFCSIEKLVEAVLSDLAQLQEQHANATLALSAKEKSCALLTEQQGTLVRMHEETVAKLGQQIHDLEQVRIVDPEQYELKCTLQQEKLKKIQNKMQVVEKRAAQLSTAIVEKSLLIDDAEVKTYELQKEVEALQRKVEDLQKEKQQLQCRLEISEITTKEKEVMWGATAKRRQSEVEQLEKTLVQNEEKAKRTLASVKARAASKYLVGEFDWTALSREDPEDLFSHDEHGNRITHLLDMTLPDRIKHMIMLWKSAKHKLAAIDEERARSKAQNGEEDEVTTLGAVLPPQDAMAPKVLSAEVRLFAPLSTPSAPVFLQISQFAANATYNNTTVVTPSERPLGFVLEGWLLADGDVVREIRNYLEYHEKCIRSDPFRDMDSIFHAWICARHPLETPRRAAFAYSLLYAAQEFHGVSLEVAQFMAMMHRDAPATLLMDLAAQILSLRTLLHTRLGGHAKVLMKEAFVEEIRRFFTWLSPADVEALVTEAQRAMPLAANGFNVSTLLEPASPFLRIVARYHLQTMVLNNHAYADAVHKIVSPANGPAGCVCLADVLSTFAQVDPLKPSDDTTSYIFACLGWSVDTPREPTTTFVEAAALLKGVLCTCTRRVAPICLVAYNRPTNLRFHIGAPATAPKPSPQDDG